MAWVSVIIWLSLAACTPPVLAPRPDVSDVSDAPAAPPADQLRYYTIWFGGVRVGTAIETETWTSAGVHLHRTETLQFMRGESAVELATAIDIDADSALAASRVRWSERSNTEFVAAEARRDHTGWRIEALGKQLPPEAVPAELVPLVVRRDGAFAGTVFLPARNFIAGIGRVEPVAPNRLVARLALDGGALVEATIDLDRDGAPARIVDGEGVIATRTTSTLATLPFEPVDLIAATALPIMGTRHAQRLLLDGELALPPVPGQLAAPATSGVTVELGSSLAGNLPAGPNGPDRRLEIRALVANVQSRIAPSLGATSHTTRDATTATAGDCTTFALAYAGLAARRAIPTRVVTGLRVDGDRLVRHRWAVSWTGRAWIAVDAAFGAVPAGGDLIGLAIHDADDAGLVAGEAALTSVRAATWL